MLEKIKDNNLRLVLRYEHIKHSLRDMIRAEMFIERKLKALIKWMRR